MFYNKSQLRLVKFVRRIQSIQCFLGQVSGQETNDTVGIYMEVWVSLEEIKKISTAEILFSAFNMFA